MLLLAGVVVLKIVAPVTPANYTGRRRRIASAGWGIWYWS